MFNLIIFLLACYGLAAMFGKTKIITDVMKAILRKIFALSNKDFSKELREWATSENDTETNKK